MASLVEFVCNPYVFLRNGMKLIGCVFVALVAGIFTACAADVLPDSLRFDAQGEMTLGPMRIYLQHFGPAWEVSDQRQLTASAGFPKRESGSCELRGKLAAGGSDVVFNVAGNVGAIAENQFRVDYRLNATRPAPTKSLSLSIDIPAGKPGFSLSVGGRKVLLPEEKSSAVLLADQAGSVLLSLPDRQLCITGDFRVLVQDDRHFGDNHYTIRLTSPRAAENIRDWRLTADVKILPPSRGEGFPEGIEVDDAGNLTLGKQAFRWICYDPRWHGNMLGNESFKLAPGFPQRTAASVKSSGDWNGFRLNTAIEVLRDGTVSYFSVFKAVPAVDTATLALVANFPIDLPRKIQVNGKPVALPAEFDGKIHVFNGTAQSLQLESDGKLVTLKGNFHLLIQDNRKWGNECVIRIGTTPYAGMISDASLRLNIQVTSPRAAAIDFKNVFNMGFLDEKADDGQGGWTDQGPNNDLRMLMPGTLSMLGIKFKIENPARNNGKSSLILSSGQNGKFPAEKVINIGPAAEDLCYLYLLHASAWLPEKNSPVGVIYAEFRDGSSAEFPVVAGRDVGNWWHPFNLSNGAVAWTGENENAVVGLYLSQFRLGNTPKKLTFKSTVENDSVWMIVGGVLGDRKLELNRIETPTFISAGNDWLPLEFTGYTAKGSPLDFSFLLDAPAGKYGPVTVNEAGHFSFRDAPGKRVRFFGPNLVGTANFLSRKTADDFVAKAVRLGYNSVRFHHFENDLLDRSADDSLTFNPAALDQFCYLFAELKKHGIYLCIDLYASRALKPGDNIAEREGGKFGAFGFEMKNLVNLSPSAMANWKEFARRLLTYRNPYTGLTFAEDPALYALNLVNENPLQLIWDNHPIFPPLYQEKYIEFLKEKKLDIPENRVMRGGLFIEFLNDIQCRCIEEQKRFLRDELKLNALITDINMTSKYTLNDVRKKLDFADNHQYWDHPSFPAGEWVWPYLFACTSSIGRKAYAPRKLMPVRIFGKPYTVTEFNFCNPNPYRAECAPLMGGYAALQDWDGLYRFAWSHNRQAMETPGPPNQFDIVNDPQAQMAERIIGLLFLRQYVSTTEEAFAFTYTPEQIRAIRETPYDAGEYPKEFSELGLFCRIGTLGPESVFTGVQKVDTFGKNWQNQLPDSSRKALSELEKTGRITSANGEITLDSKGKSLMIVTPKAEVLTSSGNIAGKLLKIVNGSRYQTVALLSLDGEDLTASRKMLLFQISNLAGSRQKFTNARRNMVLSWGKLPLLLEKCTAEIELELPDLKVEALKLDGSPNGIIPSAYENGKLRFTADTASRPGGVMVYLLTR